MSIDLDTSWLKEEELLENISTQHEREPLTNIRLHTIFIRETSNVPTIENVTTEIITLEPSHKKGQTILPKEQLLKMIQTKRTDQYKLMDILVYHVAMDHDNIHTIANLETPQNNTFLKTLPIIDDIIFDDTLFIFHKLTTIYLFLRSNPDEERPLKSILKTENTSANLSSSVNKTKKKVQLVIPKKQGITKKNL
jgi:hypothetical protein